MQQSNYIIEVKGVSKFFGDKMVLDNINLYVKKGEFVTVLGPSGCGKTTLLRLIAGFQTASEGEIKIAGKEITQTPPHKRPVNTVFQKYALFPHLNVFDNIAFGLKLKKIPKQTIEKKVKAALRMVGMTDYEYRDVNSLSGGQQQGVAIARFIHRLKAVLPGEGLVGEPGLLFFRPQHADAGFSPVPGVRQAVLHQRPAVPLALVCTGHPEAVEVQIVVPLYRDPGGLQRGVLDKDLFLDIQFPEDVPLRQAVHQPSAFSLHAGVGLFAADDTAQMFLRQIFRRQIDKLHVPLPHFYGLPPS